MPRAPRLQLPEVTIKHCERVLKIVYDTGKASPLEFDLRGIPGIDRFVGPRRRRLDPASHERAARFFYVQAVLDQGRDSVGVQRLFGRVLRRAFDELHVDVLARPLAFWSHQLKITRIVQEEHERVKDERREWWDRGGYSLYDQTRVTPWLAFRWGAPLANLIKLSSRPGLLGWLRDFPSGETAAEAIKQDVNFGLGKAIGEKASRLISKWISYTARLPVDWDPSTHEVPLDVNVGRVLMRTGYLFAFISQEEMTRGVPSSWTVQGDGRDARVNLSAQSLNDRRLSGTDPIEDDMRSVLSRWGLRWGSRRFMTTVAAILSRTSGDDAAAGQLDDGFMKIGRDHCFNVDPDCPRCPLRRVCVANTVEPLLKTRFYCGTGAGVFR